MTREYKIMMITCFLCVMPINVFASGSSHSHTSYHGYSFAESGSAEAMVADVVIARPVGLVATIVPFSLLGGNEKQAREKLVEDPSKFTFKRGLGEFPSLD